MLFMKTNKTLNLCLGSLYLLAFLLLGCSSKDSKVNAYIASAEDRFLAGDYASAEIEYLNAIKLDNESSHAFARLGVIYFDQGRPRNAAPYLRRASQLHSDDPEVAYRLALLHLAIGDVEAAKDECLQILEERLQQAYRSPTHPDQSRSLQLSIRLPLSLKIYEKQCLSLPTGQVLHLPMPQTKLRPVRFQSYQQERAHLGQILHHLKLFALPFYFILFLSWDEVDENRTIRSTTTSFGRLVR